MDNKLINSFEIWTTSQTIKSSYIKSTENQKLHGIQKLRELILKLAVRGKLVIQDPSDESAFELLRKNTKEKERLLKEGKIKKQMELPPISENEKHFTLPSKWEWFRVGDFLTLEYGKSLVSNKRVLSGDVNVFGSNGIIGKHTEALVKVPCIIIGRKGSAGALNKSVLPSWTTDVAYYLIPPSGFDLDYTFLLLQSLKLDRIGKGIKPGLNRNEVYLLIAALPPLSEQHRIVAKVNELMTLCDKMEQEQKENNIAHQILVENLLSTLINKPNQADFEAAWQRFTNHFDTLFTTEDSIEKLKETLLQLALIGKLVPQDPTDEPACELLKKIGQKKDMLLMKGKIKKQEKLSRIGENEKPFKLPDGWAWERLNNVIDVRDGTHDSPKDAFSPKTYPLVTSKNFKDGIIDFEGARRISEVDHNEISKRSLVEKSDILFSMIGGNLGNQVMVNDDRPFSVKNVALFKYYDKKLISPYFIKKFTEYLAFDLQNKASGGAQPFISLGFLRNIVIALPPIREQHRIVGKINELFDFCDRLKESIANAQFIKTQLADCLIKNVI